MVSCPERFFVLPKKIIFFSLFFFFFFFFFFFSFLNRSVSNPCISSFGLFLVNIYIFGLVRETFLLFFYFFSLCCTPLFFFPKGIFISFLLNVPFLQFL